MRSMSRADVTAADRASAARDLAGARRRRRPAAISTTRSFGRSSQQLAGASRLIVVPDPTFQDASFAAFYNASKQPLPGRRRLGAHGAERRRVCRRRPPPRLAARSPNRSIFNGTGRAPMPTPLPRPIASSQRRSGADATRERFFADAADRRIVHVVGAHGGQRQAIRCCRACWSPTSRAGAIPARSWAATSRSARCRDTGLVVIDEAGAASSNRGEGTLSLARAFMAAGVPAVVGTLPGADENATRDLMIGFHREMSKASPLSRPSTQSNATQYSRTAVDSALGLRWCCTAPIDSPPK